MPFLTLRLDLFHPPTSSFLGGTQVLTGRGMGQIERTGSNTRFGKISKLLESVSPTSSPLQIKVDFLVKRVLIAAGFLAALLFAVEIVRTGHFVPSLIVALTFGMAAVPEEFPLVFTLYLSLGAWRLSNHKVLVKSLPAVEALGSADILCTDKTGTLTEGNFQFTEIVGVNDPNEKLMWESALMACEPRPVDSMEVAIYEKGNAFAPELVNWNLVWDYPFEKHGKHMTHVWKSVTNGEYRIAMKGAVEGVLEHCSTTPDELSKINGLVNHYASEGKRLLGLAMRNGIVSGVRESDETGLHFIAILVFSDPIRPSVAQAIAKCQAAGIEIKMLTGDHPITAHYVADQAGITHSHDFFYTGDDLAKMDPQHRKQAYLRGAVFSRVLPEQKFEMVKVLRDEGRVVAMTGDGINDAPALRLADIGISMGKSATDVARSAAQIVLLESDFSGVVAAIFEGRRILSNLKRSFSYLISFHVPVILLALLPPFLGWPAILMPIHIILLELIVHPISAFTFENLTAESSRKLNHGRGSSKSLIERPKLVRSILAGSLVSLGALVCYGLLLKTTNADLARACAFSAVLLGNISFVLSDVWPQFNLRFGITSIALCCLVAVIARIGFPSLHLSPMGTREVSLAIGVGLLGLLPLLRKSKLP